ncbi:MAG: guanylate kinase [Gammaproteobacteria bacterium]|nr:guanylate kinase [Gammaproteobacteria bacterium]
MLEPKGNLYIISAPSGGGKTSLVDALVATTPDIVVSISHTTRPIRPGEQEGVNYFFTDQAQFQSMIEAQAFLEYATIFGHHYGTSKKWIEEQLTIGNDIILEIDWQGARQVKWMIPSSIGIFILPPSLQALQTRLTRRAQDNPDVIAHRMAQASLEMSHYQEYEFVIINDDFDRALLELKSIIVAERLKIKQQCLRHVDLLNALIVEE